MASSWISQSRLVPFPGSYGVVVVVGPWVVVPVVVDLAGGCVIIFLLALLIVDGGVGATVGASFDVLSGKLYNLELIF